MTIEKFKQSGDELTIDPRGSFYAAVEAIIATMMGAGYPAHYQQIAERHLDDLYPKFQDAFAAGRDLDPLLGEFRKALLEAFSTQRQRELPISAAECMRLAAKQLDDCGWTNPERGVLVRALKDGERITAVTIRTISTIHRTLSRRDIAEMERPKWDTSARWLDKFPDETTLQALEDRPAPNVGRGPSTGIIR
jgi:hypothetical protein